MRSPPMPPPLPPIRVNRAPVLTLWNAQGDRQETREADTGDRAPRLIHANPMPAEASRIREDGSGTWTGGPDCVVRLGSPWAWTTWETG